MAPEYWGLMWSDYQILLLGHVCELQPRLREPLLQPDQPPYQCRALWYGYHLAAYASESLGCRLAEYESSTCYQLA